MEEIFNKIDEILERKGQIILYGVPGVGKTYLARKYVEYVKVIDNGKNKMTRRGIRKCKLLHIHEVKKTWSKIKELAGVENRDLKSLRHTFASHLAINGVSLFEIQKLLNHKDINMTMRYMKLAESNKVNAVEAFL